MSLHAILMLKQNSTLQRHCNDTPMFPANWCRILPLIPHIQLHPKKKREKAGMIYDFPRTLIEDWELRSGERNLQCSEQQLRSYALFGKKHRTHGAFTHCTHCTQRLGTSMHKQKEQKQIMRKGVKLCAERRNNARTESWELYTDKGKEAHAQRRWKHRKKTLGTVGGGNRERKQPPRRRTPPTPVCPCLAARGQAHHLDNPKNKYLSNFSSTLFNL